MPHDPQSIVEGLYASWKARDLTQVHALLSDDMVFVLHIPADVAPFGGEMRGKAAVTAALQGLLDTYDFVAYEPQSVSANGAQVNAEVRFRYRHKVTGELIDSRLRHSWVVEAAKIKRLDEWHDLPTVKTFFARVALRVADKTA